MTSAQGRDRWYDDVAVGDELPRHTIRLTVPFIVRWCAATELFTRRDHFDLGYVRKHTDLKDIVVSGSWSHSYLLHYIKNWAGPGGWVWKMAHQNRANMFAGDVLTAWGRVASKKEKNGLGYVELEAGLKRQDGVDVVPARAVVVLPLRGGRPIPYPFRP